MKQYQYQRPYHNLGWLFYRNMFEDRLRPIHTRHRIDFSFLTAPNDEEKAHQKQALAEDNDAAFKALCKEIVETRFPAPAYAIPADHHLDLTTTYPGLLIGSGYAHETGVMGEFKLGFHFDATTGLPVIPGSSVKGVLRSAFPQAGNPQIADKAAKAYGIWQVLSEIDPEQFPRKPWSAEYWEAATPPREVEWVNALEQDLFDGVDWRKTRERKDGEVVYSSLYKRDIFHDGVVVAAIRVRDRVDQFLGTDFITPHLNRKHAKLNAFTAPIPIQFLKILPQVKLRLHFQLRDTSMEDWWLSVEQKLALFRAILLRLGLGAKTNVGYGQFEQARRDPVTVPPSTPGGGSSDEIDGEGPGTGVLPGPILPKSFDKRLQVNEVLEAAVVDPVAKRVTVVVKGEGYEVPLTGNCRHQPGDLIRVKINQLDRGRTRILQVGYIGRIP